MKSKTLVISFHSFSAHRSVASHLFKVAKSKRVSEGIDGEARPPLWCLQWSKDLTTTCECLKRHQPSIRQAEELCRVIHRANLEQRDKNKNKNLPIMTSHELWKSALREVVESPTWNI